MEQLLMELEANGKMVASRMKGEVDRLRKDDWTNKDIITYLKSAVNNTTQAGLNRINQEILLACSG